MRETAIRNSSGCFGLGLAAGVWVVNQLYPDAPGLLVALVGLASVVLIVLSAFFGLSGIWKPKKEVTDALLDLSSRADSLAKFADVKSVPNRRDYIRDANIWVKDTESLLQKYMNDEEVHMFSTITPMINDNSGINDCMDAVKNRKEKLRKITGRYFRGENIR